MLKALSSGIDSVVDYIGSKVSWLCLVLVLVICVDVLLRYTLSNTKTWILDLEWHLFSVIFLIGSSYALQYDEHVRVDVFYQKFSKRTQTWIDLIGSALFLIPWCAVVILTSWKYAMNSWYVREGSPDDGLPARYVIKFMILIGFVLLLLQGISIIIKKINHLRMN